MDYKECIDLNDLLDLKKSNELTNDYVYILHQDYGLNKDFYYKLDEIDSLKTNVILGYENIKVDNQEDKNFTSYNDRQDNQDNNIRKITFIKIKTELILKLENQELKDISFFL